jgi:hypothetical protein
MNIPNTKIAHAVAIFKENSQKPRKEVLDIMIHSLNIKPYRANGYYRHARNIVLKELTQKQHVAPLDTNKFNVNSTELMEKLGLGNALSLTGDVSQQAPKSITIRFEF